MAEGQRANYLESKVLTASGPQLHLMLIEGAMRFGRRAEKELAANNEGHANQAMLRALDIVAEMLAGVRHSKSEINQKLSDLYQFLFHTLTSAYVNADAVKLADVLRILEFERETWRLACSRVSAERQNQQRSEKPVVVAPHIAGGVPASGLSIEA